MPTPPPPQTTAERLAERYGRTPRGPWWRRPLHLSAAVVVSAAALAYLVWVAVAGTAGSAEPTVIGYRVLDDTRIELRYTVALEPGSTARCVLQALDSSHGEVGVLEDTVGPAAERHVERTPVVRTTGRAVTAVVRSCEVAGS